MNFWRTLAALAVAGTMGACANPHTPLAPEITSLDYPKVGEIVSREVGETLIDQYTKYAFEVAVPVRQMRCDWPTAAGYLSYRGDLIASVDRSGTKRYCGEFVQVLDGGNRINVLGYECFMPGQLSSCWGMSASDFRIEKVSRTHPDNFQRQLIYTGKSGKNIYVSYREFKNDLARPAFTQDLTFDLADGNVIGFKGARIEIVEAKNTSISYRLIEKFQK
ncbi:MAG TPA: hypothetical protein VK196_20015 [Magnetospirillum sp.]|nr:hypothetical protein [Magnetospirillum sp.]